MAEEERREEAQPRRRRGIPPILLNILIPLVVSLAVYFSLPILIGSNQGTQKGVETARPTEVKAVLIQPGTNQTFLLKGGKEVAVIDSLTFTVGSDTCRAAIGEKKDEIMDALAMIFLSKERSELSTTAGQELLKRQIREAVNVITGFVGDREKFGVLKVFLYIKAFASTE